MTQQEFVKKESEFKANFEIGDKAKLISSRSVEEWDFYQESFASGLTKGLEIAKEFLCWVDQSCWDRYEEGGDTWYNFQSMEVITTDELLTIFLTEKYNK